MLPEGTSQTSLSSPAYQRRAHRVGPQVLKVREGGFREYNRSKSFRNEREEEEEGGAAM